MYLGGGQRNAFLCFVINFFTSATASILSLSVLFMDRYFAVRHPMKYRQYSKCKDRFSVSCIIWVAVILLVLIYLKIGAVDVNLDLCSCISPAHY